MIALLLFSVALQTDASAPEGEPVLDPPTLHCLGASWTVRGDDDRDARVEVAFRREGAWDWRPGPPLFRVERGAARRDLPAGTWLFAGSVVGLDPGAPYEIRLTLIDPDGGRAERVLKARTLAEPVAPPALEEIRVRPGPRALRDAARRARPGTAILLHAGVYEAPLEVFSSGEPGRPIVWRAAGDGEAILDAGGTGNGIVAPGVHDVWFEGLTVRRAVKGLTLPNSSRIVVRRCRFLGVTYGVFATVNDAGDVHGLFLSDNVIEGPCTWPRTKGIENARGIQVTGVGHVIAYNRIRGFADAIDTLPSARCAAIDIHNNDVSEMTDDGIELDYSERNVRCFANRLTNVYQGISAQPVYGGPAYVFRNVLYNVVEAPFKLHQSPSGVLLYHNTVVKKGTPLVVATEHPVRNCVSRNNLFLGSAAPYAAQFEAPMVDCDFDADGFGGGPWNHFLKWNGVRYATLEEARAKAPAYRRAVVVATAGVRVPDDPARAYPPEFDGRVPRDAGAADAGVRLPGFNDAYAGRAPDLGAVENGAPPTRYGPR